MPKKEAVLYRRSTALVAHWVTASSTLVIKNYILGTRTAAPSQLAFVLLTTAGPLSIKGLMKSLRPLGYAKILAPFLIKQGIFVRIGSRLDRKEKAIEAHWAWGSSARHFYFSTATTRFRTHNPAIDDATFRSRGDPPSPFHDRKGKHIPLPPSSYETTDRVFQVLAARRTLRCTAGKEISLDNFSRVLRWTWGATHVIDHPFMRQYLLKTSPSGGGRHPTEVYAVVMRVRGLAPGIYHYSIRHDDLTLIKPGFFEEKVIKVCCQGNYLRGTSAVLFMTSIVERSMWKYPVSHALRVLLLDAGHLGQTFHIVSTALGLAPFSFAAVDTAGIEKLLAIDGVREIPIYTCAIGVPATTDDARADRLGREVGRMETSTVHREFLTFPPMAAWSHPGRNVGVMVGWTGWAWVWLQLVRAGLIRWSPKRACNIYNILSRQLNALNRDSHADVSVVKGVGAHAVVIAAAATVDNQFAALFPRIFAAWNHSCELSDKSDVAFGAAGVLLAAAEIEAYHQGLVPRSLVRLAHRQLIDGAQVNLQPDAARPPLGFAHGFAGQLLALETARSVFNLEPPRDLLRQLMEVLEDSRREADDGAAFWPFAAQDDHIDLTAWCNGSAGIALSLLGCQRFGTRHMRTRYRDLAVRALRATAYPIRSGASSFCCGSVGRAHVLIEAYRQLGDPLWAQAASEVASTVPIKPLDRRRDFRTGNLGVIYLRWRLAYPTALPFPAFGTIDASSSGHEA